MKKEKLKSLNSELEKIKKDEKTKNDNKKIDEA
jgi:hypothetical protein